MNTVSQTQDLCIAEVSIERILPCRRKSKWVDSFFYKTLWNDHPAYIKAMCCLSVPLEHADYLVDLYTDDEPRQTFYLGELGYRTFMKYYIF
ncbi:hypothetical protein [Agarilytica rhodophyticola]|uniref:hypothetical protein n=1 Tax=Agarilytica rhodophyticola TaxID=1737490 RepID=UPI000B342F14|nr:hypothetical protein [Agarilytica rhodophyticola]